MKQFAIIFSLLFVFVQNISAQADTSTVFTVAIDEKSDAYNKAGTQLSFTRMNVLYVGVENPIAISVPGVSSKDITAQISSGGTIKKQEDGSFIGTVPKVGRGVIVVKVKGKEVSRHEFRAKRVPDPIVSLAGKLRGGNIQGGELAILKGLVALLNDFDFSTKYSVTSFEMVYCSGGKIERFLAVGPMFSEAMIAKMKNAKQNDIILFDEIRLSGPDGQPRKLGGMSFVII